MGNAIAARSLNYRLGDAKLIDALLDDSLRLRQACRSLSLRDVAEIGLILQVDAASQVQPQHEPLPFTHTGKVDLVTDQHPRAKAHDYGYKRKS